MPSHLFRRQARQHALRQAQETQRTRNGWQDCCRGHQATLYRSHPCQGGCRHQDSYIAEFRSKAHHRGRHRLDGRSRRIHRHTAQPCRRASRHRSMREQQSVHERHGVVLVDDEARSDRCLPQHQSEAPSPLRGRILGSRRDTRHGHRRPDGGNDSQRRGQASPIQRPDRVNRVFRLSTRRFSNLDWTSSICKNEESF